MNLKPLALLMRILTAFIAVITIAVGGGFYAGYLPPSHVAAVMTALILCIAVKEAVIVFGDILDDGQRNHSFMPEAEKQLDSEKRAAFPGRMVPLLLIMGIIGGMLVSCASPLAQTAAQIGLAYAQKKGVITEGDKLVIGQGIAIVTSKGTRQQKEFQLSELGLKAAVDKGLLNEGDAILVQPPGVEPLIIGADQAITATK